MRRLSWLAVTAFMFISLMSMPQAAQAQRFYVDVDGNRFYDRDGRYWNRYNNSRRSYYWNRHDNGLHRGWYKNRHHNRWDRHSYWDRHHRRWR